MSAICIITALPAESRAFIDAFKLRPILDHGWRLYGEEKYLLLQTGIGKLKAAAAVSALLHARKDITTLINAGIAGGPLPLGTAVLANRVTDSGTGASWYPHMPPQRVLGGIENMALNTLDIPSSDYQHNTIFDMEAAGIMSAANYYISTDNIHFLKVISDNADSPLSDFDPRTVTQTMQALVPLTSSLAEWSELNNDQAVEWKQSLERTLEDIVSSTHHSSNDTHQLRRLLQQHVALKGDTPNIEKLVTLHNSAAIRKYLKQSLANLPLTYSR